MAVDFTLYIMDNKEFLAAVLGDLAPHTAFTLTSDFGEGESQNHLGVSFHYTFLIMLLPLP